MPRLRGFSQIPEKQKENVKEGQKEKANEQQVQSSPLQGIKVIDSHIDKMFQNQPSRSYVLIADTIRQLGVWFKQTGPMNLLLNSSNVLNVSTHGGRNKIKPHETGVMLIKYRTGHLVQMCHSLYQMHICSLRSDELSN